MKVHIDLFNPVHWIIEPDTEVEKATLDAILLQKGVKIMLKDSQRPSTYILEFSK